MEERSWKLGEDLRTDDNLLDPITFDDLILAVHCNCRHINEETVKRELSEFLKMRFDDMLELLKINIGEIVRLAKEGRETS